MTHTTLSTDLLRQLALMQHKGEDYFIVTDDSDLDDIKTKVFEGTEEDARQQFEEDIEGTEEVDIEANFMIFCENNLTEVQELDPDDYNNDYWVLTDEEADEKAKEYIKDSLWAFNADFIISHSKLPYDAQEMIESYQREKCESANDTIAALIEDMDEFISDAISADGRGHFMSSYDGNENEETVTLPDSITTEQMEDADIDTKTTFYIYRIN